MARRARPLRLRDGGHRQLLRVHPPDADVRLRGQAGPPLCRASQAGGTAREGAVGEPHSHPGERGLRHRFGPGGHGEHRARPDRGPAHGEQGARRADRGRAAVSLVQPDVLGAALARLLGELPRQSLGGPRVRVGRRSVRTDRRPAHGSWWWVEVLPGSRRREWRRSADTASPLPKHPTSLAGSSGWPGCSRAGRRSSICSTGTSASSRSSRSSCASTPRWTPTRQRASTRTWWCSRPARNPPATAGSVVFPPSTGSPASIDPASSPWKT